MPAPPAPESAHDILRARQRLPLTSILAPKVVAVIGATEKPQSVGRTVFQNLGRGGFEGVVYPINPKRSSVLCVKAYPDIAVVPEKVDLAVVCTPAKSVPGVISECAKAGVPGVIIISAGFKEIGAEGAELEQEILSQARETGMRIVGPNCLGVMVPKLGLNATFATTIARPGGVGFLSQSGALCTAVLDWSLKENVGFSLFASLGSMLDVSWGDLIYHLGDDPDTKSIVIYMETIGDARAFLSAAREVALTKPIIVIKPGRTEQAAKAAASHTGSLTGSDEVLEAAFRRAGVLRVNTIAELFHMAEVLGKQPRPKGPKLTIITNAGGPGVLATDMLVGCGGELAVLSPQTFKAYSELLPPHWSRNNPVDILGDAAPETYARAIDISAKDPNCDGVLVILTPQAMTDPTGTAEQIKPFAKLDGKPILASWMGGLEVARGEDILNAAGIPTYDYPDTAARAFQYMWRYSQNLKALYETPALIDENTNSRPSRTDVEAFIQNIRKSGRAILTEFESKKLLAAYGIPTVETYVAKSESEAVRLAAKIGYPVVLKLYSETITHKTDVGGVQLNIRTPSAVKTAWKSIAQAVKERAGESNFLGVTVQPMIKSRDGYEIILGSSIDPQFGPVLLFGAGGQLVEVFKDRALALPPLNATLARRLIEQTKIYTALKGVRGRATVNLAALEELLVRFSQLVVEQRWISEIDVNPLLASPDRLLALDARVVLHDKDMSEDELPTAAIRPYPVQYVSEWKLKDGTPVTIRPIRPEDEPLMVQFHQTLSEESVYHRYFSSLKLTDRIAHERLTRICFNDYDREIALVVERKGPRLEDREILGVGRLSKLHSRNEAEFALLVSDRWQRRGLGSELMRRLVAVARAEKLSHLSAIVQSENHTMQHIAESAGLKINREPAARDYLAEIQFF
ncbi:MAG TPA: bifunctional acetate--CoA ligase family protein/GNAT family N-acetyltransferase [Alphaproteobacteria bacterium]|nr:bifunctional acetate--CoA ligase family protein/GNAT family N-acetyltransferase [Alphaproteobacteria bacterium]